MKESIMKAEMKRIQESIKEELLCLINWMIL